MSETRYTFVPDYVVIPGKTIKECLDNRRMTAAEFAEKTGMCVLYVDAVIRGTTAITESMAESLVMMFDDDGHTECHKSYRRFWLNLEANYQADLKRLGLERPKEATDASS